MIFLIHPIDSKFQPAPLEIEAASYDDQSDPEFFLFYGETLQVDRDGFKVEVPKFVLHIPKLGVLKIETKETRDSKVVKLVWPRGAI